MIRPKVEQHDLDGVEIPWNVSGLSRAQADLVPQKDGRVVYGGTPADETVIQAIQKLNADGKDVMFYPFLLMDQLEGNARPDPYGVSDEQPHLPWRGRITLSRAPGVEGSPDGQTAASAEVEAFMGVAAPGDFSTASLSPYVPPHYFSRIGDYSEELGQYITENVGDNIPDVLRENFPEATERFAGIHYSGPVEWSYRRFILHYATLCQMAGGVHSFCIGSEMRGLTSIRGAQNSFPAVAALRDLAADVRAILGPDTQISYAADWSEYFGYHPQDGSGDVWFHLDPLWADENIDFVGIDNYMPLSDWRDGQEHLDRNLSASQYDLEYLQSNIEGGEGFDWYYHSSEARDAQIRTPIKDTAYGEDWVFRYKDLRSWWENPHRNRPGGVRDAAFTEWVPGSKPIVFTEIGCPSLDKGANQPNTFYDPKSSESALPYYSSGRADELIQKQFLRAQLDYWTQDHNALHPDTGVQMIDTSRIFVWAWDARPFPAFPNNLESWSDAENYRFGHWINGRTGFRTLGSVVREICARSGVYDVNVSGLHGIVRGYKDLRVSTARAALQPLAVVHGFDAVERDGFLRFSNRDGLNATQLDKGRLAVVDDSAEVVHLRSSAAEMAGRVRLSYVEAGADYATRSQESIFPEDETTGVSQTDVDMILENGQAHGVVERWLAEARVARDIAHFALPPSCLALGAGDVVDLGQEAAPDLFRIDRIELSSQQQVEAVRIEPEVYRPRDYDPEIPAPPPTSVSSAPVYAQFMDLPLHRPTNQPHAPYLAVCSDPWPGSVAVYSSASDSNYQLNSLVEGSSILGQTTSPLAASVTGMRANSGFVDVRLSFGALSSVSWSDLLNGANVAAIGDGTPWRWELFQFETAELIGERTYRLSGHLRGQFGTEHIIPQEWPEGSIFVLLDNAQAQIQLSESARDLPRHYRIGPAQDTLDRPSYQHHVHAFQGVGLRPYAPVHLSYKNIAGDWHFNWIRRSRVDGDNWNNVEVPLGEDNEQYQVKCLQNGVTIHEETVTEPAWVFEQAQQALAGALSGCQVSVSQVSNRFGPGPAAMIVVG